MPNEPSQPDPSQLQDTVADFEPAPGVGPVPAPAAPPAPVLRAAPRPRPKRDPLGETVAETRPSRFEEGLDLARILDRAGTSDDNPLSRYDPEAGKTRVAVRFTAATEAVSAAVTGAVSTAIHTPFGRLLLSLIVVLGAIVLTIAAATFGEMWMIVAAGLADPLALLLVYWRYQVWLGHKRYLFRLLETLGEDMTDYDPRKVYRKAGTRNAAQRRR